MLIEKIIEFELRGPRIPSCTYTSKTGYFYDKAKMPRANTQVIIYC